MAEFLRQIRMAVGPIKDPLQNRINPIGEACGQSISQRLRVVECKFAQIDPPTNVEWRSFAILDQVGRCGDAKEGKGEPLISWVSRPFVVDSANGGKEVVSKIEVESRVDLID